jgi:hypothetical protein
MRLQGRSVKAGLATHPTARNPGPAARRAKAGPVCAGTGLIGAQRRCARAHGDPRSRPDGHAPWGSGERLVFEPCTKETFEDSFA